MPGEQELTSDPGAAPNLDRPGRARRLLRASRYATLATTDGLQPFTALITPAFLPDLSILLLLSELSQHTRHLAANSLCAVFCSEHRLAGRSLVNPQTIARISVACRAFLDDDPASRARYLAVHPYAQDYAGYRDFQIWRLTPLRAHFVQGFAQASSLAAAQLTPPRALVRELIAEQADLLDHCNGDRLRSANLLGRAFTGVTARWRVTGVDGDGCDLIAPDAAAWVPWLQPLVQAGDVRPAFAAVLAKAREISEVRLGGAGVPGSTPVSWPGPATA